MFRSGHQGRGLVLQVVAGEFRRADESTLKQRRIFKARRGAAAAVPASAAVPTEGMTATTAGGTAAPAAANPFASISLTAPAGGNPFSGVSLVPPADALKPAEVRASCQLLKLRMIVSVILRIFTVLRNL